MFDRFRAWYARNAATPSIPDGFAFPCLPTADGRAFEHGIELRNDEVTPMAFVLSLLQEEVGLAHREAAVAVALCHETGGAIVPMPSREQAADAAARIATHADREGWPLRCRAVSAVPFDEPSAATP
jgi:ATP-dependent Clp protease adapter protein ClpS